MWREAMTTLKVRSNVGSSSVVGPASSTEWPNDSRRRAASSTAAMHSGSTTAASRGARVRTPIRNAPGGAPSSSANGRAGGGAEYQSPVM